MEQVVLPTLQCRVIVSILSIEYELPSEKTSCSNIMLTRALPHPFHNVNGMHCYVVLSRVAPIKECTVERIPCSSHDSTLVQLCFTRNPNALRRLERIRSHDSTFWVVFCDSINTLRC